MSESQAQSNASAMPKCGFFNLPYELRLRIYEDLLVTEKPIPITMDTPRLSQVQDIHLESQLLRTGPQIHYEAADVLYGSNTFEILGQANGYFESLLRKWLGRIGKANVARLNKLKLSLLYPLPTRSGLLYVDTTVRLRKPSCWKYTVKYQEDGQPWTAELERDFNVEEQLEVIFRRNSIMRKPWSVENLLSIYNAVMQIRPNLKNTADMPAEVGHFFGIGPEPYRSGSWM